MLHVRSEPLVVNGHLVLAQADQVTIAALIQGLARTVRDALVGEMTVSFLLVVVTVPAEVVSGRPAGPAGLRP